MMVIVTTVCVAAPSLATPIVAGNEQSTSCQIGHAVGHPVMHQMQKLVQDTPVRPEMQMRVAHKYEKQTQPTRECDPGCSVIVDKVGGGGSESDGHDEPQCYGVSGLVQPFERGGCRHKSQQGQHNGHDG